MKLAKDAQKTPEETLMIEPHNTLTHLFETLTMAGLYIHIPYCRHKCAYCDFFSSAGRPQEMDRYVDALIGEWQMRRHELNGHRIQTVYIGGGTPSILPFTLIERLLSAIAKEIDINSLQEVTLEANPEDITTESIKRYMALGFNRISVGVQSFHQTELDAVNRMHSPEASRMALSALSGSGINYNADLIYGLPGQTLDDWDDNLRELLSYSPPHISAYLLSYEPGTRLYARLMKGDVAEATEATASAMFNHLRSVTQSAGYHHYEISNLSLPGREARHNSSYWNYTPYLGLGASAHSFDGFIRRFNPPSVKKYISAIESHQDACIIDDETPQNRFNDYIITSLRTSAGFDPDFARSLFGDNLMAQFLANAAPMIQKGEIIRTNSTDGNIMIPQDRWLVADATIRDLII